MEAMKFNTAVAQLMICVNAMQDAEYVSASLFSTFLKLLFPFAPHLASELWQKLGHTTLLDSEPWPVFDPALIVDEIVPISVQAMGKHRGTIQASPEARQDVVEAFGQSRRQRQKWLDGQTIKKSGFIFRVEQLISDVGAGLRACPSCYAHCCCWNGLRWPRLRGVYRVGTSCHWC